MNFNLKQLLALAGTGMAGAGIGYGIGNMQGDKEIGEVKDTFNAYNKEENQQIADQAFISGAQYALNQMGGLDKQSSLMVLESFRDELEKVSGIKDFGKRAINKIDEIFLKGIREKVNMPSQFAPKYKKGIEELAKKNKKNLITGGATVAGVAAAGVVAKKMSSSDLKKEAFMTTDDLEDNHLGIIVEEKILELAKDLIQKEKDKSFTLRHPILTGIPTLGLLPMIKENNALHRVAKTLMRKDDNLASMVNLAREDAHRKQVELDEANRYSNAAEELGYGYLAGKMLSNEKTASFQAAKGIAMKAVDKLDDVFLKGIRGVKNFKPQTSQFGPKVDNKLNEMKLNKLQEHASRNKRNLAIAGGSAVAGIVASKVID